MRRVALGLDAAGRRVYADLDDAGRILGLGVEEVPQPETWGPGDAWPTPPDVLVRPRLSAVSESVRYAEGGGAAVGPEAVPPPPVVLPPWLFPPFSAFGLDVPAVRIPQTVLPAASLVIELDQVPSSQITVLVAAGWSVSDATSARLTVRINRQPVPPLVGIVGALGTLDRPTRLASPIIVPPSQVVDVLVENVGVAAVDVAVRFQGWRYATGR
jgi:hypothetical protein